MGIGCALWGSGALCVVSIALGRDAGLLYPALVYPSWLRAHTSTYLSIPEVPTPSGLLSSLSGLMSVRYEFPGYLGRALVAREAYGRLPLFDYLFSSNHLIPSQGS